MRSLEQESIMLPHVCWHKPTLLDALQQGCCDCFTSKEVLLLLRLHHLAHETNDPHIIQATNEVLPVKIQENPPTHQPSSPAQK